MITLDGIEINPNMYLGGLVQASKVSTNQQTSLDGVVATFVKPLIGGEKLTLGTTTGRNGALQGMWCQSVVDEVKNVEGNGQTVVLDYHGDIHHVVVSSTASLQQFNINEPVTPTKAYTGNINLLKVA